MLTSLFILKVTAADDNFFYRWQPKNTRIQMS